jgi:hypothetical protein
MTVAALHSGIGFARAAMLAIFYLHLERQTRYVLKQLDAQITELENGGEEAFHRKRQSSLVTTSI